MKHSSVILIFSLASIFLSAQNKPPVALDDHISTQAGVPIAVNVLENDFCVFGNSIKIFIAGNPGNGDVNLGQSQQLAPFFDRNKDGWYDPDNGDYPLIKGDQAIYFIFNDDRDFHTSSGGEKMKIEIHGMAYGFECTENEAFHNTIFLHYKIFNRSHHIYSETYLGFYNDFDLGYPNDDYIETDVAKNSLIAFNSEEIDGNGTKWDTSV